MGGGGRAAPGFSLPHGSVLGRTHTLRSPRTTLPFQRLANRSAEDVWGHSSPETEEDLKSSHPDSLRGGHSTGPPRRGLLLPEELTPTQRWLCLTARHTGTPAAQKHSSERAGRPAGRPGLPPGGPGGSPGCPGGARPGGGGGGRGRAAGARAAWGKPALGAVRPTEQGGWGPRTQGACLTQAATE